MMLVGVTGNYGMGKSIVLSQFKTLGAITIDSDKIVESLLSEKKIIESIRNLLGNTVCDEKGNLDKKKVANLIFKNDILKNSLENILHPLVFDRIESFLFTIKEKNAIVVIEIPLLYEKGYEGKFDRTITVFSDEEKALKRLEKNGISNENAMKRLQSQLPIEEKNRKCDFIIDNNGTLEETMAQVTKIYSKLLQEAGIGNN
jgi:dephospho-CoA kinase